MQRVRRASPKKRPRPFGEPILKHKYVAKLLGVRPKDLTGMPLRRVLFDGTYLYDPAEVSKLMLVKNNSTLP